MRKILFFFITLFFVYGSFAANVDTISIYSNVMHFSKKCVVIVPSTKNKDEVFPTVYLLHGYAGDFSNWIKKVPSLKKCADEYHILIVCPDGDYSSWYFDSPVDASMKYETYIAKEVPEFIEAHYHVIKNRNARAITGLSMGGHGALFLAIRHTDFFGACGSMSGVVDLKFTTQRYDLTKRLGDTIQYADNWKKYSVTSLIETYSTKDSLPMIIDCGNDDPFAGINRRLHEKMLQLKIPHDYIERPGNHNWDYWANAVQYQLLFFRRFFDKHYPISD